jgi:alkanesulfonate monooxygenase SsuD/methylene tetrahydromethanopterin reductase-like flavin-dependent oxidoreductase (luciferase family)
LRKLFCKGSLLFLINYVVNFLKFGLYLPNYGKIFGNARNLAEIAKEAENVGWDGFFIFDHILVDKSGKYPIVDPWVALSAIAMNTSIIQFGTTVTPLPRRRPWKLARETVSIDHLSNGRLILSVGLGTPPDAEYGAFNEETDIKIRAKMLDEGLDVLFGLWSGKPFSYNGMYYKINDVKFIPKPIQQPRITVWGAGYWPSKTPFIRAARLDGIFPLGKRSYRKLIIEDFREIKKFIFSHRTLDSSFDIVMLKGVLPKTSQKPSKEKLTAYAKAGITWMMFYLGASLSNDDLLERIRKGPP